MKLFVSKALTEIRSVLYSDYDTKCGINIKIKIELRRIYIMNGAAIIVSRRKLEEFINAEEFERELEKYMYDAKVELHLTE